MQGKTSKQTKNQNIGWETKAENPIQKSSNREMWKNIQGVQRKYMQSAMIKLKSNLRRAGKTLV